MTEPTYVQEYNAIVQVLNKYMEGNARGSSAAMKPAFHERATLKIDDRWTIVSKIYYVYPKA